MNTQQLECFTTLAKTLNYAKTAEQLSMSQPAVSRQIQSLETELGAQLFNRTTRSVSLTQVGFQFLPLSPSTLPCRTRSLSFFPGQNLPMLPWVSTIASSPTSTKTLLSTNSSAWPRTVLPQLCHAVSEQ